MAVYHARWLKSLYDRTPVFVQDFATSMYGRRLIANSMGTHYRSWLDIITRSQWWSEDELEAFQNQKLRAFVGIAYSQSPYWKRMFDELGLDPARVKSAADLTVLPRLVKDVLQRPGADVECPALVSEKSDKNIVWMSTSGTTGKALRLALTSECFQRDYAFRDLHRSWGGVAPTDRNVYLMSYSIVPVTQQKPPFWRHNRAANQLIISSPHLSARNMPHYLEKLVRFAPLSIHGFPSGVYLLALGCLAAGETRIRPRAVFTGSETLLPVQRKAIEEAFGCRVFNWYGNTEMAGNIVECERGSLHVKQEHSVVEFLDETGQPVGQGGTAEIVSTAFGNVATPLIRYRTGDLCVVGGKDCACGRPGQLVEQISGRSNDFLITPDGRHVRVSSEVFAHSSNVVEGQIYQEDPSEVVLRIVKRPEFTDADLELLIRRLRSYAGNEMKVTHEFMEQIPRERSGKYRYLVSKVPLGLGPEDIPQS
jgi:phenylacetate-CoA ligase